MWRILLILVAFALPAAADPWAAARLPGAVVMIRHAQAPGTGDPEGFRLNDCATQRNLSAAGRAQARQIGAALRAAGVAPARVLTSRWCRARETAALLDLGTPEDMAALDSFFEDRSTAAAQTAALRDFLAALPPGQTVVLVTHQVNITALTGEAVASGEAKVLRRGPDGQLVLAGRLPPP